MIDKETIIKVASDLFLKNGVKTVTLDRITKELHTSKRTIYAHFSDKTDLLKSCLNAYHARIRKENEEVIRNSENAIEAMGYLHQHIVNRANVTNPNFFNDILHYYPGLLSRSYGENGNFAHEELMYLAKWGIKDGLFEEDLDIHVTMKTVLNLLKLLKDTDQFPVQEYSKTRLTFGIMLPYLRGICTKKGIELLEMQKELFYVTL
jgi:AcrR family transcriptional regulator